MRKLITLIESAEAPKGFALAPFLDHANYQITDSLKDAPRWRAKILSANSGAYGQKVGQMDAVGYVMISKVDNTIVPIARADEHHCGADLLDALCQKTSGNPDNYVPIYAIGNNYVYSSCDIPKLLKVITKFVSYGGNPDLHLIGSNDLTGKCTTLGEFVESRGQVTVAPGKLNPAGRRAVEMIQQLSRTIGAAAQSVQRSKTGKSFTEAGNLIKFIGFELGHGHSAAKGAMDKLKQLAKDDLDGLTELIFGFDGVKNKLHNELRAYQARVVAGESLWTDSYLKKTWGDIPLAIDMLGKI